MILMSAYEWMFTEITRARLEAKIMIALEGYKASSFPKQLDHTIKG